MVFQDALAALNPVHTVGYQLTEVLRVRRGVGRGEARRRAIELLDLVKVPRAADRIRDYPHQFSGGMRQRVMIAAALAMDPEVLIADEPTTALDVTVQAQILRLLAEIQAERQMGLVLITHDLGVVATVADDVTVMYAGHAVEQATVQEIFAAPAHPYTRALLRAMPRLERATDVSNRAKGGRLDVIPGRPPRPGEVAVGCPFHPRCDAALTCVARRRRRWWSCPADGPACATWRPRSWRQPVVEPPAGTRSSRSATWSRSSRCAGESCCAARSARCRPSTESRSRCGAAARSAWWASRGPASRRWRGCWWASSGRRAARCSSTASTSRRCRGRRSASCAAASRSCSRTPTRR